MVLSLGLLTLVIEPVDQFVDNQLLNVFRPLYDYKLQQSNK